MYLQFQWHASKPFISSLEKMGHYIYFICWVHLSWLVSYLFNSKEFYFFFYASISFLYIVLLSWVGYACTFFDIWHCYTSLILSLFLHIPCFSSSTDHAVGFSVVVLLMVCIFLVIIIMIVYVSKVQNIFQFLPHDSRLFYNSCYYLTCRVNMFRIFHISSKQ